MVAVATIDNDRRVGWAPPPPTTPVAPAPLSPVEQGAKLRHDAEMTQLQRENFPEYARRLSETLAPEDRDNKFAYSLGYDVPIEVKRQVLAEYQSGANAPRVEVGSLGGSNATYTERDGPNGTIRVNSDLIGSNPTRRGQMEAFAVWGHLEETGHWADARANALMGRPGADSVGDEGARYALMAMSDVTGRAPPGSMIARYDLPVTAGGPRPIDVDVTVLKALATEKLANGSFARENRVDGVENFGPEGHYQTTYLTAIGAGRSLGMPDAQVDQIANRLALGSQLPDMLENFDAASQFKAKATDIFLYGTHGSVFGSWTPEEQRHLESVYEGLHALPRESDANPAWLRSEREQTRAYIQNRIAAGDFVTAGVAIHRYGDLHAHVRPDGIPYSGDLGHGLAGHTPDYLYTEDKAGNAAPWSKAIDYQSALSDTIAQGLSGYQAGQGRQVTPEATRAAADSARTTWRAVYDSSLAASTKQEGWFTNGADAGDATETWFRQSAAGVIQGFHQRSGGFYAPLTIEQTGVGGDYRPAPSDIRSLDTVRDRFDAFN